MAPRSPYGVWLGIQMVSRPSGPSGITTSPRGSSGAPTTRARSSSASTTTSASASAGPGSPTCAVDGPAILSGHSANTRDAPGALAA
jgi:hypothetical protein